MLILLFINFFLVFPQFYENYDIPTDVVIRVFYKKKNLEPGRLLGKIV